MSHRYTVLAACTVAAALIPTSCLPAQGLSDGAFRDLAEGLGAMRRADWEGARKILQPFADAHPQVAEARYQLGGALLILGRYEEAQQAFSLAASSPGFRGGAAYNGACAAALGGDLESGYALLATAVGYPWVTRRGCELDGDLRALRDEHRWPQLFALAAQSRPELSDASYAIDRALDRSFYTSAREALEEWVEENPEDGLAYWRLGLLAERQRRWDDAVAAYTHGAQLPFDPPLSMLGVATAYARSDRTDDAITWVERALDAGLDPESVTREEDLGSLRSSAAMQSLLARWHWTSSEKPSFVSRSRNPWSEEVANPEDHGLRSEVLQSAAREIAASAPRLNAFVLVRGGELIFEEYFNGTGPDHADNVKSISKSITAALAGIALERRDLESADTPLVDVLPPAFEGLEDEGLRAITLRHLLNMTSGLQWVENGPVTTEWMHSEDMVRFALELPRVAEPGAKYTYNTANIHLAGAAIAEATGKDLYAFATEHLLDPLGMSMAAWSTDFQGRYEAGSEMRIRPRDLARFGLMMLDGGHWNGEQVVPQAWVRECLVPSGPDPSPFTGYGLTWRTENYAGHRVHYALGLGWQYVLLVPDLDMVLVLTGNSRNTRDITRRVFQAYVLHALN